MEDKKMEDKDLLDEFKKDYDKFSKKYGLPEFGDLNSYFDVEELAGEESDFILKKIRRKMGEKTASHMRLMEVFLKPCDTPLYFFKLIKNTSNEDKEMLQKIYLKFGEFELDVFVLENEHSEEAEAEMIKKVFDYYMSIRPEMVKLFKNMKVNYSSGSESKDRGYFG